MKVEWIQKNTQDVPDGALPGQKWSIKTNVSSAEVLYRRYWSGTSGGFDLWPLPQSSVLLLTFPLQTWAVSMRCVLRECGFRRKGGGCRFPLKDPEASPGLQTSACSRPRLTWLRLRLRLQVCLSLPELLCHAPERDTAATRRLLVWRGFWFF